MPSLRAEPLPPANHPVLLPPPLFMWLRDSERNSFGIYKGKNDVFQSPYLRTDLYFCSTLPSHCSTFWRDGFIIHTTSHLQITTSHLQITTSHWNLLLRVGICMKEVGICMKEVGICMKKWNNLRNKREKFQFFSICPPEGLWAASE